MKFQKGDLVRDNRAGGFGTWASSRAALVLGSHEERGYYLYLIEGSESIWRPEMMVTELEDKKLQEIRPRIETWLDKLNGFNLTHNPIMTEIREALKIAVDGLA